MFFQVVYRIKNISKHMSNYKNYKNIAYTIINTKDYIFFVSFDNLGVSVFHKKQSETHFEEKTKTKFMFWSGSQAERFWSFNW